MNFKKIIPIVILFLGVIYGYAQSPIQEKTIRFEAGKTSATIEDQLTGDQTIDYLLRAEKGQLMSIQLKTSSNSNYFNLLPPGSQEAIFIGSINGTEWSGHLPQDGVYKLRVYLMPNAARRNVKAVYTLQVSVTGEPYPDAVEHDAMVPGTPYHATGSVRCYVDTQKEVSQYCDFGVIRRGSEKADVYLTTPGGQKIVLIFDGDKVRCTDPNIRVKANRKGYDDWSVSINGNEFYTIPDAVINGG